MSNKHDGTVAKEILEQTQNLFKTKRENTAATQPEMQAKEFEQPSKKYEPTSNFSKVFSETISQRTRPSIDANFKDNPRLTALSENSPKEREENKEDETEHSTKMKAKEFGQESPQKFEPTPGFFKVFSEIIGENSHK